MAVLLLGNPMVILFYGILEHKKPDQKHFYLIRIGLQVLSGRMKILIYLPVDLMTRLLEFGIFVVQRHFLRLKLAEQRFSALIGSRNLLWVEQNKVWSLL